MLSRIFYVGSAFALVVAIAADNLVTAQENAEPPSDGGQHYRAKQILGAKVGLEGSSAVGIVDDIVLDEHGNVDYLLVITSSEKLVTVPWDVTRFNVEKRFAVVVP